ncbi:AP-2 complex subunit beta [Astathelohania contejeani]|uniref:AP-2 complex subunit beta n=1 Tax=Astathelohania contejeani TaxID=164912 RepID=A0ABQ7HYV6_9MICR|nr:AP-2 complex subunit beta [Thelohania contejeani]
MFLRWISSKKSIEIISSAQRKFFPYKETKQNLEVGLASKDIKTKRDTMHKIICMMQNGYDVLSVFDAVIREIDTNDVEMKRFTNYYILKYASLYEGATLMCVNTLLKDVRDKNEELRRMAIYIAGLIGDKNTMALFHKHLMTLKTDPSAIVRATLPLSIINFVKRDSLSIKNSIFSNLLKTLAEDSILMVAASAIYSIAYIIENFTDEDILDCNDISNLIKLYSSCKYHGLYYEYIIQSLLRIIYFKSEDIAISNCPIYEEFAWKLLYSTEPEISIFAGEALLRLNPSFSQTIFDSLLTFIDTNGDITRSTAKNMTENDNQTVNDFIPLFILKKLDFLIRQFPGIEYDNIVFSIFSTDNNEIKKIKLDLLLLKPDEHVLSEINSLYKDSEYTKLCVDKLIEWRNIPSKTLNANKELLLENIIDHAIKNNQEMAVEIIYNHFDKFRGEYINQFLMKVNNIPNYKQYLFLCGRLLTVDETEEIRRLIMIGDNDINSELIRFYVNIYLRGIISDKSIIEKLKMLPEKCKNKVNIILQNLNDIGKLKQYSEFKRDNGIRHQISKHISDNEILDTKPFQKDTKKTLYITNSDTNSDGDINNKIQQKNLIDLIDVWGTSENTFPDGMGEIIIDRIYNEHFLGVVVIKDRQIILKIEKVINLFHISGVNGNVGMYINQNISESCLLILGSLKPQFLNESLMLRINNEHQILIQLSVFYFIETWKCDLVTFNSNFNRIQDYILLDENFVDSLTISYSDKNSFVFKIMDVEFYGRTLSKQVILKSECKELLKLFK